MRGESLDLRNSIHAASQVPILVRLVNARTQDEVESSLSNPEPVFLLPIGPSMAAIAVLRPMYQVFKDHPIFLPRGVAPKVEKG